MTCQEGLRLFTLTVQFQNQESKKIQNKTTLSLWFKENKGKNKHREKILNFSLNLLLHYVFFLYSFHTHSISASIFPRAIALWSPGSHFSAWQPS